MLYYLNNRGDKWIILPKEKVKVILPDGSIKIKTILSYESFGNFGACIICYKGKKYSLLADTNENNETILNLKKHLEIVNNLKK